MALARLAASRLVDYPQRQALEVVQLEALAALQAAALPEQREREKRVQRLVWLHQKSEQCRQAAELDRAQAPRTPSRPPALAVRRAAKRHRQPRAYRPHRRVRSLLASRRHPRVWRLPPRHLARMGKVAQDQARANPIPMRRPLQSMPFRLPSLPVRRRAVADREARRPLPQMRQAVAAVPPWTMWSSS